MGVSFRGKWIWPTGVRQIVDSKEGQVDNGEVDCRECRYLGERVYCLQHEIDQRPMFFCCISTDSRNVLCATPLHQAALCGHAEVCQVLLELGNFRLSSAYGALVIAVRL